MKTQCTHKGSKLLKSNKIVVEVMDPSHTDRYNTGVRFTPLAAVLSATISGQEFFSNPVEHNPETEHAGLATEFDLASPPPGFQEAKVGESFVKIGVGLLKKTTPTYQFWVKQVLVQPAPTTVSWEESSATFKQSCKGSGGYAYDLAAVVKVTDDAVSVTWTLTNTGSKPFTSSTYTHNFFRFNDLSVGPDYSVSFPFDYTASGLKEEQKQTARTIAFNSEIPTYINAEVKTPADYKGPNQFTVTHARTGQTLIGTTSIAGEKTALHASKSYVCPEQFVDIPLKPKETKSWTRTYTLSIK